MELVYHIYTYVGFWRDSLRVHRVSHHNTSPHWLRYWPSWCKFDTAKENCISAGSCVQTDIPGAALHPSAVWRDITVLCHDSCLGAAFGWICRRWDYVKALALTWCPAKKWLLVWRMQKSTAVMVTVLIFRYGFQNTRAPRKKDRYVARTAFHELFARHLENPRMLPSYPPCVETAKMMLLCVCVYLYSFLVWAQALMI